MLDNDFYQFTMSQWAKAYWPHEWVRYEFKNRSKVNLLDHIDPDILKKEIEEILPITTSWANWLGTLEAGHDKKLFDPAYINELNAAKLPDVNIGTQGDLQLSYEGPWWTSMLLETPLLALVNELWFRAQEPQWDQMNRILDGKIAWLKKHPYIKFFEFGTRRRYSKDWQTHVMFRLITELPWGQLLGTSNPWLAHKFGTAPRGTMAHQMFMCSTAMGIRSDVELKDQLQDVLSSWRSMYGETWDGHLLILLTDTFGTDWLLDNVDPYEISNWHGFRQDSGDPIEWGYKVLNWCNEHDIDAREKLLAFSDGLTLDAMLEIYQEFAGQADVAFGWGTNLTNDSSLEPLSIVIKPALCNDLPCVKLSDNIDKCSGDPAVIEFYKHLFGYKNEYSQNPTY